MNMNSFYFSFIKNDKKYVPLNLFATPSYFTIISKMKKHKPYCIPFLSPVKKKEAPNYYEIIKKPIDLSSMMKKAEREEYSHVGEIEEDLRLMADNCRVYNGTGLIVDYGDEILRYGLQLLAEMDDSNGEFAESETPTIEKNLNLIANDEEPYQKVIAMHDNSIDVDDLLILWIARSLQPQFGYCKKSCLYILSDVIKFIIKKNYKITNKNTYNPK